MRLFGQLPVVCLWALKGEVGNLFEGKRALWPPTSSLAASGELLGRRLWPLTSLRRRGGGGVGSGFPWGVNRAKRCLIQISEETHACWLQGERARRLVPQARSPRSDPTPVFVAPQECVSPSTKTSSLASRLFIHNCKQTEAGSSLQLPSWLKTRLAHLLWIISSFPNLQ